MGDFFTSPKERGATNLFDLAMGGTSPFDSMIQSRASLAKTGIDVGASRGIADQSSQIASQLASMGVAPGSAMTDTIAKNATGIREGALGAKSNVDIAALGDQLNALMQSLQLGYGGLSQSSTFGDILAGLTTGGKIASGVALGGGPMGLGLWGLGSGSGSSGSGGGGGGSDTNTSGWDQFLQFMSTLGKRPG